MTSGGVITLSVNIKRKVGADELEWRATANATKENRDGVYDLLNSTVDGASRAWLETYSAGRNASGEHSLPAGAGVDWYPVERVSVTVDNGKRYIKLHCGRWSKHGVVVWPEVLERAGIRAENIPDGGIVPETWKACIASVDGNKPRCINVTHAQDKRGLLA